MRRRNTARSAAIQRTYESYYRAQWRLEKLKDQSRYGEGQLRIWERTEERLARVWVKYTPARKRKVS